jgi:hypothetical protein
MELFSNSFIEINNSVYPDIKFEFLNEDEEFGILEVKTSESPITTTETLFLFSLDVTASMNETAYGNTTKLDIVKQTFKSMIQYLTKIDAPVFIRLHCFNTEVTVLLETINIKDKEKVKSLYLLFDELYADNATNIEIALKEATTYLDKYKSENPTHQICHIFMTDGYATSGNTNNNELYKLVSDEHNAIFVGFGKDHNISLLKKLTSKNNTIYQFINDMEDTSMIYGESIHSYLYPVVKDVELEVVDGFIYDWKNNEWTTSIKEGILSSNSKKIYNIKKDDYDNIKVNIYGIPYNSTTNEKILIETVTEVPDLIDENTNEIFPVDLTKYMLRQKTQILLFEAKSEMNGIVEIISIKKKIKALFDDIRSFMNKRDMMKDKFMIQLCDDLSITYKNIGTNTGNMFILSRYTSQGRQQTYSATPKMVNTNPQIPSFDEELNNFNMHMPFQRSIADGSIYRFPVMDENDFNSQYAVVENQNNEDETSILSSGEIENYIISGRSISCYSNDDTLNTITQIANLDSVNY